MHTLYDQLFAFNRLKANSRLFVRCLSQPGHCWTHLSVVTAGGIVGALGCCMAVPLPLCEPQANHLDEGRRALGQQLHIPAHLGVMLRRQGCAGDSCAAVGCPGLSQLGQALTPVLGGVHVET